MQRAGDIVKGIIETGAEITGGIGGALIGTALAGPVGLVIGGASGPIMAKMLKEFGVEIQKRIVGPREEKRIGAAYFYAIEKILQNKESGKEIRDDGFFTADDSGRSAAEEIFEGIILKSQREYEEKKIRYFGNLMGNISFDPLVDRAYANQLIKTAEQLSYNQLCLLKIIFMSGNSKEITLRKKNYREPGTNLSREMITVLYDIIDLENRHLIINSTSHVFGITDINPGEFEVQGNGNALVTLMELKEIPDVDYGRLMALLNI
ncbi:MAG: hypothetical protein J0H29_01505 [Sphingobacteriales bacterium]|nr:hypothetical protein [Sphingobacteriales bacterium]